jgi:hypothetical protein
MPLITFAGSVGFIGGPLIAMSMLGIFVGFEVIVVNLYWTVKGLIE